MAVAVGCGLATPDAGTAQGGGGRLTVAMASPAIAFPDPGILDFDTGWIDHSGVVVSLTSRPQHQTWELRIRADAVSMGGYGKPMSDILWRTSTSTVWTPLTATDQPVLQGQGDTDVTLYFRIRLDWAADLPGSYASGITFTAVRP